MQPLNSPNQNYQLYQDENLLETEKSSQDFDSFLNKVYLYYLHQGFSAILLAEAVNIFIFLFIVGFTIFLTSFVNYSRMIEVKNQTPISDYFDFSISNIPVIIWILSLLMMIFWTLNLFQLILDLPDLLKIRSYYRNVLKIENVAITDWNTVVDRMYEVKDPYTFTDKSSLPLFLALRLMRKENYLIAAFNRNLLASSFLSYFDLNLQYTKSVEWALNYAVWNFIFENDRVRIDLLNPVFRPFFEKQLRRRVVFFGIAFLLLSPIIFLYLLIYYSCSYFDQIRTTPSILGGRMWSRHALWKFREFNELSHYFSDRMAKSRKPAAAYIHSFPSYFLRHLAHFVGFVIGALLIVILILGFLSDDILVRITIFDRSLLYFAGAFGIILTVTSSLTHKDAIKGDSQLYLDQVTSHIHYRPSSWQIATSPEVLAEVKSLFPYRISIFFSSILGVLIGPLWLIFSLPQHVGEILEFIQRFTHYDLQLGYIYSLSTFDHLRKYGNPKYGAPSRNSLIQEDSQPSSSGSQEKEQAFSQQGSQEKEQAFSQQSCSQEKKQAFSQQSFSQPSSSQQGSQEKTKGGKMENSILTFTQNHPQWIPPPDCQEMIQGAQDYLLTSSSNLRNSAHLALSLSRHEKRYSV